MHKIGDKVVCIRPEFYSTKDDILLDASSLVRDKIYPVLDVRYCSKCGTQTVCVGVTSKLRTSGTCQCGSEQSFYEIGEQIYCSSSRFVPLDAIKEADEAVAELLKECSQPLEAETIIERVKEKLK